MDFFFFFFKKADLLRTAASLSLARPMYVRWKADSEGLQPHSASWLVLKYRECHESSRH